MCINAAKNTQHKKGEGKQATNQAVHTQKQENTKHTTQCRKFFPTSELS